MSCERYAKMDGRVSGVQTRAKPRFPAALFAKRAQPSCL